MPITIKEMLQGMASSGEGASDAVNNKLKSYLQGQQEERRQQNSFDMLEKLKTDPEFKAMLNQGGSLAIDPATGQINLGANPYARLAMQGPHEAATFLKSAQGTYKGINDQLDAAQGTLDALNQKNSASDKLALINEAKLAAGSGGSRAIKSIMDSLTGGRTVGSDFQTALNYLQNQPSTPTMTDDQRNAIRESVFSRMGQVETQKNQADTQLMQQGPIVAPHTDSASIVQSLATPATQRLQRLKQMQQDYQAQRSQMPTGTTNPVSQPSQADQNQTTLQKLNGYLHSMFKTKPSPQQQAQPATQQLIQGDAVTQELAKRAKQALNQPQQPQAPQSQ